MKRLLCVVEGHGDAKALPVLVSRWLRRRAFHRQFVVDEQVIRARNGDEIKHPYDPARRLGVEFFVQKALAGAPDGILVVVDSDKECLTNPARKLGRELADRARSAVQHIPVSVVVANTEFESWYIADLASLRARGHLPVGARVVHRGTPEVYGKGTMTTLLGRKYEETNDQLGFAELVSLAPGMARRSRSFAKFVKELEFLVRAVRRAA